MLTLIVAVSGAIALFFFTMAIFFAVRVWRRQREERLSQRIVGAEQRPAPVLRIRDLEDRARGLGRRLRSSLAQAGVETPPARFLLQSALLVGLVMLLAGLQTGSLLSGLVFGALAVVGIQLYISRRRNRRLAQMDRQIPTALEVMMFSLRAGGTLEEAPLSHKLRRCYDEYALGRPIEASLQQLRARWISVRAIYSFVEGVTVLKRTGGNLIEVMGAIIENLRAQAAYEARHRALTSEGRISGKILMALPLLTLSFQAVTAPAQLRALFATSSGRLVLLLAAVLWLLGVVWVSRLVRPARRA